jgi:Fe-S-cluster containining protein
MNTLPCNRCTSPCCRVGNHGWQQAVHVDEDERFVHWAQLPESGTVGVRVVPYNAEGRCIYLTKANTCSIYGQRPRRCREFDCSQNQDFLAQHPAVALLVNGRPTKSGV